MEIFRKLAPWGLGFSLLGLLVMAGCGDDDDGGTTPVNHNPVVNSVTVSPASVPAGGMATVTVSASDQDGDQLTYSYTVTGGGIVGNGAVATWTAPSTSGAHTVTVTVNDGNGGSHQGTGVLNVQVAQTGISGSITAPPGPSVDLRNMLVRVYASLNDYANDAPMLTTGAQGSEFQVSFQFVGLAPGNYWLDAWKDADASGDYSANDIWAVHATGSWGNLNVSPILVTQGSMTNCTSGLLVFIL